MDLERVFREAGGVTRIARHFGIHHSAVCQWRVRGEIPAERVPEIARLSGVPRHELRPDLWEAPAGADVAPLHAPEHHP